MNSEKTVSEPVPEMSFEPTVNETSSDVTPQEAEPESTATVDNNEFLLDVPQSESETQDMEQASQLETPENNLETTLQEQPQVDERSEMVNNAVPEMNENVAPEINLSTPVELSDVSSNQAESATAQPENQVKSTLSLDQILDTELSSNPQYSDNSKATPQNAPASGGKSKI
ncbi:hypothetical protein J6T66_02765 [bacterium]|nr:hypothetical protein [bacterium]